MAGIVGSEGRVIATDADAEIIALAGEDAKESKLTNITFQQPDACVCLWHQQFDLAYARFLLSHLSEPENCVAADEGGVRTGRNHRA